MTSDSLQQLRRLAAADVDVMAAIRAATTDADIVRIARTHGIAIEASDLVPLTQLPDVELSDDDLEAAAGGSHPKYGTFTDACL